MPLLQALQMGILYMEYCSFSHREIEQKIDVDLALIKKKQRRQEKILLINKDEIRVLKDEIKTEKLAIKAFKDKLENSHFWKCYYCSDAIYAEQQHLDGHMQRKHEDKMKQLAEAEQRQNDPSGFLLQQNVLLGQQMVLLVGHQNKSREHYLQTLALKEDIKNAKNQLKFAKLHEKQLNNKIKQNYLDEHEKQKEINEKNELKIKEELLKRQAKSDREIKDLKQYVEALEQRLNEVNKSEQQAKANALIKERQLLQVLKQQEEEERLKSEQTEKNYDEIEDQIEEQQLQQKLLIEQNTQKQKKMWEEVENFYALTMKICQNRMNGKRIQYSNEEREKAIEYMNNQFNSMTNLQQMGLDYLEDHLQKMKKSNQNFFQRQSPKNRQSLQISLKSIPEVMNENPKLEKQQNNTVIIHSSSSSDSEFLQKSPNNQSQDEIKKNQQESVEFNFNTGKKGSMISLPLSDLDERKIHLEKFQLVKEYVNKYVVNQ